MTEIGLQQKIITENLKLHRSEAEFYEVIHEEIFNLPEQRRLKREVKKLFAELGGTKPALDLGCGTGNMSRHLLAAGFHVTACDLSRDMLNCFTLNANKVRCEAGVLPFKSGSFALISTYSFLHHLPELERTLHEICRVANRSAVLYFDHEYYPNQYGDTAASSARKPSKLFLFMGQLLWFLSRPKYLKQLIKFLLGGRKKHHENLKQVDFNLTERTLEDRDKIIEILKNNNFIVMEIKDHNQRCLIKAQRKHKT